MNEWPSKEQETWFQAGVIGEQGRIIKLLESQFAHAMEIAPKLYVEGKPLGPTEFIHSDNCSGCRLIALIKGEK